MKPLECKQIITGIDIREGQDDYPYELCDELTNVAGRVYDMEVEDLIVGSYRLVFDKTHVTDNMFDGIKFVDKRLCYQYCLTWYGSSGKEKPIFSYINVPVDQVEAKRIPKINISHQFIPQSIYDDITIDANGDVIIRPVLPAENITLNIVITNPEADNKKKLVNAYDEAMKGMLKF